MPKIPPINNIKTVTNTIKKESKALLKDTTVPYEIGAAVLGATGLVVSTFLHDFRETVEENYFQLKEDPATGLPYTPDEFQTAAGMNLSLGNDVLVTAPTGIGKTAIAQYIITKNLKEGKKTFYTTPIKALSSQKYREFCEIYGEENVGIITGDTKINTDAPIIIMTTEVYRNKVLDNSVLGQGESANNLPKDLRTVIFDEVHNLGDVDRGGVWEQSIMFTPKNVQILSLSATIGNNEEINNWMASLKGQESVSITPTKTYKPNQKGSAETVLINVPPEKRRVPLTYEILEIASELKIPTGKNKKETIKARQEAAKLSQSIYAKPDISTYKRLVKKFKEEDKLPTLFFIFSRKDCRNILKYLTKEGEILTTKEERDEISKIIQRYRDEGVYLGESLNIESLRRGYAVHNAGLLPSQKQLVEELFQKKLLKVVLATGTLAAGINMPARSGVICSPRKPATTNDGGADRKRNLTPNELHQKFGRIARPGYDTQGFCYALSCNFSQYKIFEELIKTPCNDVESHLNLDYSFITKFSAKNIDNDLLRSVLSRSFYVYDGGKINYKKLDKLFNDYKVKKEILSKEKFIVDGELTLKGKLIGHLNGYEQIPVINMITNGSLKGLSPVQLAGIIGGLANIESNAEEFMQKIKFKNMPDKDFTNAAEILISEIRKYDLEISKIGSDGHLNLEPETMLHLYTWAKLNDENPEESLLNWQALYHGPLKESISDEGSLFKEFTTTIDLLRQLIKISDLGYKLSETDSERDYYDELSNNLREALSLVQKEPANVYEL